MILPAPEFRPFGAALLCWASLAAIGASQDTSSPGHAEAKLLGSLSCASASCHGSQDELLVPSRISRREYALWLEHDPHAKAVQTVQGEKFQQILDRLAPDEERRLLVTARCAACHDPLAASRASENLVATHVRQGLPDHLGFSCESCHGPAEHWLARHYEDGISREELRELGMVDTKDPRVRARQCVGCHVGDGRRDMNHDMIAAGHPPLRFEISAYHDLIRRKHWSDRERVEEPHFKAQLWAAGQVAAAEATAALLQSRSARAAAGDKLTPWPEFAEYDCFACHQRLRPAGSNTAVALKSPTPGIPGWQPWNLALTERMLGSDSVSGQTAALRELLGRSLFPDPAETERLAGELRQGIRNSILDPLTASQLVELVQQDIREDQSWASSCQQLLALQAAYLAWRDETRKLAPTMQVISHAQPRRLPPPLDSRDEALQSHLTALNQALRFGSPEFEWPAHDWAGLPAGKLRQASPLADERAIAEALRQAAREIQLLVEAAP
jgi:hypothetical protein